MEFTVTDDQVLSACRNALEGYGRGEIQVWPRRESWTPEDGLRLFMPARIGEWEGFKVLHEAPPRNSGALGDRSARVIVRHPASHRAWRLPAGELTDARTGAVGVLAAEFLAAERLDRVALIGSGGVARSLARSLHSISSHKESPLSHIEKVAVYSRSDAHRRDMCAELGAQVRFRLEPARSLLEVLDGAGIVFVAVAADRPVLKMKDLAPGTHVCALSGSPTACGLDADVLLGADMVVVDQMEQCRRSGELACVEQAGGLARVCFARWNDRQAHLGDAALGRLKPPPGAVTVAYLTGLGLLDVAVAVEWIRSGHAPALPQPWPGMNGGEERPSDILVSGASCEEEELWRPIP